MANAVALVWDLAAKESASPAFLRVAGAADKAATATERATKGMETAEARMSSAGAKLTKAITLPLVGIAAVSLKMAGDFQQSTNVLVTAAGESVKNLAMVRKGILDISTTTGTSWKSVTDGMYQLEKAGYRGAAALQVEKAAAQGAREEGASLSTVTAAMTSIMASYHLKASDAVMVMNQMKTAAGESKTTMEQFAGSLSTVLPLASANKISFADIAGSLASLTQHGTTADEAAQELAFTMRGLAAPNMVAVKEMAQLGISSVDVAKKLGDGPGGRGLAGTLNYLSETVLKRMGKSGLVLLSTFNASKVAAADAAREFNALAPSTQKIAAQYAAGSISAHDWTMAVRDMSAPQANLAKQWAVTQNSAHGFQQAIKNGVNGSQTYSDAIKKMTGGANGLNTVLQLTGESMAGTNGRIAAISKSAQGAGKDVSGWASTQKLFNVQLDMLKQKVAATAIQLGTALMPAVMKLVGWVQSGVKWFTNLSSGWKKFIGYAALAAAAIGPVLLVAGKLVSLFGLLARANALVWSGGARVAGAFKGIGGSASVAAAEVEKAETSQTSTLEVAVTAQVAALERLAAAFAGAATSSALNLGRMRAAVARTSTANVASLGASTVAAEESAAAGRLGGLRAGGTGSLAVGAGLLFGGQMLGHAISGNSKQGSGRNIAGTAAADAGVGAAIGSLAGPEGIAIGAALGAGYGALSSWIKGMGALTAGEKDYNAITKNTNQTVTNFASALEVGGAKLAANQHAAAAAALAHTGLAARAAKAGLTQTDLTNAITGNDQAFEKLVNAWRASGKPSEDTIGALYKLHQQFLDATGAAQKYADSQAALLPTETKVGTLTDLLTGKLGEVGKANVTAAQYALSFKAGLESLTKSVSDNGNTLDGNTSFGMKNIAALRVAAGEALAHAQAVYNQTGSLKKADAALESDRAALLRTATQSGLSATAATKVANSILGIPTKHGTTITVSTPGVSRAISQMSSLWSIMNSIINAPPIKPTVQMPNLPILSGGLLPGKATGGLVSGPGSGTSDTAGLFHLSNGEFVATAASQARNRAALEAGNRGAQLQVAGRTVQHVTIHQHITRPENEPTSISLPASMRQAAAALGGVG